MTTEIQADIEERVRAGAALLDESAPGWEDEINLETLDIASCSRCVLAQVFGGVIRGLDELGDSVEDDGESCGFEYHGYDGFENAEERRLLTAAWRALIESRKGTR